MDHHDVVGEAALDDVGRRRGDPLLRAIVWDLLITTAGFLMAVTAVLLTMQSLSVD
jgi:hypothetical protein